MVRFAQKQVWPAPQSAFRHWWHGPGRDPVWKIETLAALPPELPAEGKYWGFLFHGSSDRIKSLSPIPSAHVIVDGGAGDDGAEAIGELVQGFLALEPHARHGLRIALVDPPDAGPYLREMVKLHDNGKLKGAHIVVYRHDLNRLSLALRLDEGDEDRVEQLFHATNVDRRFTFQVRERPSNVIGPGSDEQFHIAVVFDRGGGRSSRVRPAMHPIQPLAVPGEFITVRFTRR